MKGHLSGSRGGSIGAPTPRSRNTTRKPQCVPEFRGGVLCLLTALRVHDIGTQLPAKVWIAIPQRDRTPVTGLPIRVVRFSGASLRYGIDEMELEGVAARITTPARTIVDCFRFRRLVGKDVALEAIRDGLDLRKATVDQICRAAEVCRAESLVHPVLEALQA